MMAPRFAMPGVAAIVLLGGCTAQGGLPSTTTPPPSHGSCGAEKVGSYVGTVMNDDALAKIKSTSGAQTVRIVGPRDAMTMDFREDRLTITTDDAGRIKTLRCV